MISGTLCYKSMVVLGLLLSKPPNHCDCVQIGVGSPLNVEARMTGKFFEPIE